MNVIETNPAEKDRGKVETPREDLTGRDRFTRNVVFAWAGYLINVVAGLIMPRLISDRLGQSTLGLWDFAWSVVGYFGILNLGLGGTMHRYVAQYRAVGDVQSLAKSVSTIALSLRISALIVFIASIAMSLWIVPLFQHRLGADTETVRLVVLFLGFEIAISMFYAIYVGILAGCHRWDLHNSVTAVTYIAMTVGMISSLLGGGGLATIACVHCITLSAGEVFRARLAKRICPELKIRCRLASWKTWLEQARFTAKTLIPAIADLLSNQSLNLLIAATLGPAMLAIYSRPVNLTRQMQGMAAKFGNILTPTASSLQARNDQAALRQTLTSSSFGIAALALPAVATLSIFGDFVIRLWMGDKYVFAGLMPLLALGVLTSVVSEPVWSILSGMNVHGRIAIAKLIAATVAVLLLSIGLFVFNWSLLGAAFCFILPKAIVDGVITPCVACRKLGISISGYFRGTFARPAAMFAPYTGCLLISYCLVQHSPHWAIAVFSLALIVLAVTYWAFVLPQAIKHRILGRLGLRIANAV